MAACIVASPVLLNQVQAMEGGGVQQQLTMNSVVTLQSTDGIKAALVTAGVFDENTDISGAHLAQLPIKDLPPVKQTIEQSTTEITKLREDIIRSNQAVNEVNAKYRALEQSKNDVAIELQKVIGERDNLQARLDATNYEEIANAAKAAFDTATGNFDTAQLALNECDKCGKDFEIIEKRTQELLQEVNNFRGEVTNREREIANTIDVINQCKKQIDELNNSIDAFQVEVEVEVEDEGEGKGEGKGEDYAASLNSRKGKLEEELRNYELNLNIAKDGLGDFITQMADELCKKANNINQECETFKTKASRSFAKLDSVRFIDSDEGKDVPANGTIGLVVHTETLAKDVGQFVQALRKNVNDTIITNNNEVQRLSKMVNETKVKHTKAKNDVNIRSGHAVISLRGQLNTLFEENGKLEDENKQLKLRIVELEKKNSTQGLDSNSSSISEVSPSTTNEPESSSLPVSSPSDAPTSSSSSSTPPSSLLVSNTPSSFITPRSNIDDELKNKQFNLNASTSPSPSSPNAVLDSVKKREPVSSPSSSSSSQSSSSPSSTSPSSLLPTSSSSSSPSQSSPNAILVSVKERKPVSSPSPSSSSQSSSSPSSSSPSSPSSSSTPLSSTPPSSQSVSSSSPSQSSPSSSSTPLSSSSPSSTLPSSLPPLNENFIKLLAKRKHK
jgi:uncharacterized protein YoxC